MINSNKVLIIVPAYNEGLIIQKTVSEIKSLYPSFSILVVNDGSTDDTGLKALDAGAIVINHTHNLGIGGAIQTGFIFAKRENYTVAVQMDGDGQHDPHCLSNVIAPVLEDKLDLCIGSRFLIQDENFKSTTFRRIGIKFFAALLGFLTKTKVTDPTSGYRAINRSLFTKFADYYPIDFPEPEAIQIAHRYHARIGEVPALMRARTTGHSSIRYIKTFYYMIKVTLAILIDTLKRNH